MSSSLVKRVLRRPVLSRRQVPSLQLPTNSPQASTLVTVGVTTYNDAAVIDRCLQSLLDQTLAPDQIEILVVDDGSTDATRRRAEAFASKANWAGFTVLKHRNTGSPSKGRNTIVDTARGEFLFLLDADDYLGPQALEATTKAAVSKGADVVVGRYVGVNRSAPNILPPKDRTQAGEYHAGWLNSLHIQKLFRTEFLRAMPYRFNETLIYASDHPYMIAAFLYARRVAMVDDVDCYFITLEEPQDQPRGHVSRASIPVNQQLRFLNDCFGLIALARGQGGDMITKAGKMRAHLWNRLLKLHLPTLLLRKSSTVTAAKLGEQIVQMAELYGAENSRAKLVPEAREMLAACRTNDGEHIQATAAQIREEVVKKLPKDRIGQDNWSARH